MKFNLQAKNRGIALMMVLIVVMVFSAMAGLFAYSMKVETKLARNTSFDADFEWAARGGVEVARWVLANDIARTDSSLNKWAGGPGDTNGPLAGVNLDRIELGERAVLSIKIVDNDSKFNINSAINSAINTKGANAGILDVALTQIGVDASLVPTIRDSLIDWWTKDPGTHLNGAGSDFYKRQDPPYLCKDGPIDDLSELLLVNGITPAMYWGSRIDGAQRPVLNRPVNARSRLEETTYELGFIDLFTALSSGRLNINTAKAEAFLVFPGIYPEDGEAIVQARTMAGSVDGKEEALSGPQDPRLGPALVGRLMEYNLLIGAQSMVFEANVTAAIGGQSRTAVAVLRRNGPTDVQVLSFWWK